MKISEKIHKKININIDLWNAVLKNDLTKVKEICENNEIDMIFSYKKVYDVQCKYFLYWKDIELPSHKPVCNSASFIYQAIYQNSFEMVKYFMENHDFCINYKTDKTIWEHGNTYLIGAIKYNHIKIAKYIVEKYPKLLYKNDMYFNNAYLCAVKNKNIELMEFLEKSGANIHHKNGEQKNAVMIACEENHIGLMKYLIDKKIKCKGLDSHGRGCINYCIQNKEHCVIKHLLDKNISLKKYTKIIDDIQSTNKNIPHSLFKHFHKNGLDIFSVCKRMHNTFLHVFVNVSDIDNIKYVLDNGININSLNFYEQHCLFFVKNKEILYYLVKKGANVNHLGKHNDFVETLSFMDEEVLNFLIQNGYDINKKIIYRYNKCTILFYFTEKKNISLLKILLNNGVNINFVNDWSENVLFKTQREDIWKLFIKAGINMNQLNRNSRSFLCIRYKTFYENLTVDFLDYIIENGFNLHLIERFSKLSFFECLCAHGRNDIIKYFFDKKCGFPKHVNPFDAQFLRHPNNCTTLEMLLNQIDKFEYYETDICRMTFLCENEIIFKKMPLQMFEQILIKKYDVNMESNHFQNIFFDLCSYGKIEYIKLLLKYGANINIKNNKEQNAFFYCRMDYEVFKFLYDNGCDMMKKDLNDHNFLHNYFYDRSKSKNEDLEKIINFYLHKGGQVNHFLLLRIIWCDHLNHKYLNFLIKKHKFNINKYNYPTGIENLKLKILIKNNFYVYQRLFIKTQSYYVKMKPFEKTYFNKHISAIARTRFI